MKFAQSGYAKDTQTLQQWETLEGWTEVKGYDFNRPFDFARFIDSYATTGIQGSNLSHAIAIARTMRDEGMTIFLSATSNMVSSGNREIIRYLVEHKLVHCLVMSAGAVEEDVIKTMKPFVVGTFDAPGRTLAEKGIGRIGNIFAPYDRYLAFERFMQPVFDRAHEIQRARNLACTPSEITKIMGECANSDASILAWAARNGIQVFCPALTDGSLGDLSYFRRRSHPDFCIDIVGDHEKIVDYVLAQAKTGAILLGGGVSKHYVLNANIFREGLDAAIYLTTATEHDGSDSGGSPQEAIAWAKIKPGAPHAKVVADASITFPLLVAGAFTKARPSES